MLEAALEAGLSAAGVDVYMCGPMPTPGGRVPHARAAAVRRHRDQRVAQPVRRQRHQVLLRRRRQAARRASSTRSRARWTQPLRAAVGGSSARRGASTTPAGRYIEFCKSTFPDRARPARAGASSSTARTARRYHVAPPVFHELGADVIAIGAEPERHQHQRRRRRDAPEAPRRRQVREHKADLGIALDGDGDRLLMVDGDGRALRRRPAALRDRDATTGGAARWRGGVVGTLMTNFGFEQALARAGHRVRRAPRSATATCSR